MTRAMAVASSPGGSRRARSTAAAYVSDVTIETLAHSISAARSRMPARSKRIRSRPAASATAPAFWLITSGAAPPTACGQK